MRERQRSARSVLSLYFSEIRDYPLLTRDEEKSLARRIRKATYLDSSYVRMPGYLRNWLAYLVGLHESILTPRRLSSRSCPGIL